MTANDAKASGAGASSPAEQMWDQADWPHIEAEVKRLQMRIAKAIWEGRWNKAKALQRLLTRSHSEQDAGRQASDGKQRQENAGGRRENLADPNS